MESSAETNIDSQGGGKEGGIRKGSSSPLVGSMPISSERPLTSNEASGKSRLSAGSISCIDCGNQAKKDCSYRRCRTCCRSRGLACLTHVKSTWIPAAKRRERHTNLTAADVVRPKATKWSPKGGGGTLEVDAVNTTSPISPAMSPRGSEINFVNPLWALPPPTPITAAKDGCSAVDLTNNLPMEIRAQALFKCVTVTEVNEEETEYAYQATVKIGRHIFRGILYDQGIEAGENIHNLTDLQLAGEKGISSTSFHISKFSGSSGKDVTRGVPIDSRPREPCWE